MRQFKYLFTLLLALNLSARAQNIPQVVKNVSAADFKKAIAEKKGVIIDLRTTDEINSKGKIKDAVQIDFLNKDAEKEILALDKTKTYLVYCAGGGRSSDAAELMSKNGFKDIINLTKGFGDWQKNGFEIEKK